MTEEKDDTMSEEMTLEQWLAIRKEEGLKIDPTTAEVCWCYAQVLDPYGVRPDLPEECQQIGRAYFARRPGGDILVSFHDLPDETREALFREAVADLPIDDSIPF
jgi:hypothetical protein